MELGAGFDAQPSWYGMVIEEIDDEPGQDERLGPGAVSDGESPRMDDWGFLFRKFGDFKK